MKMLKLFGFMSFIAIVMTSATSITPISIDDSLNPPILSPMGTYNRYYTTNENQYLTFNDSFNTSLIGPGNLAIMPDQTVLMSMGANMPSKAVYGDYLETQFQWTPNYCKASPEYIFNVDQYYNGGGAANTFIYHITVTNVNRDPIVVANTLNTIYAPIGQTRSIEFTKSDPDRDVCMDDTVTWSTQTFASGYVTSPSWTNPTEDKVVWTWTPSVSGDIGTHHVTVGAIDSHGRYVEKQITVVAYQPAYSPTCIYDKYLRVWKCK